MIHQGTAKGKAEHRAQNVSLGRGNRQMFKLTKHHRSLLVSSLLFALLGTARVSSALDVGDKAPDFKLPSTNGVDIALSDFRGKKWVFLEFYAAAFVPT
jgi:AhpC/TSA family protein